MADFFTYKLKKPLNHLDVSKVDAIVGHAPSPLHYAKFFIMCQMVEGLKHAQSIKSLDYIKKLQEFQENAEEFGVTQEEIEKATEAKKDKKHKPKESIIADATQEEIEQGVQQLRVVLGFANCEQLEQLYNCFSDILKTNHKTKTFTADIERTTAISDTSILTLSYEDRIGLMEHYLYFFSHSRG